MEEIVTLQKNIQLLIDNFDEIIKSCIADNDESIIKIQQNQMLLGENSEGDKIGMYQDVFYADEKYSMNTKAGHGYVDLKYSGDFYNAMFLKIVGDEFEIDSTDEKAKDLKDKYNKNGDIFGINDNNFDTLIELIEDKFLVILKEKYNIE